MRLEPRAWLEMSWWRQGMLRSPESQILLCNMFKQQRFLRVL